MNNSIKWAAITGLFLVTITPLIISSSMLFPFITGKGFFFRIVVEIVFALYLILAVRDPQYRPKKSWLSAAVLAFVVVVFIADMFGINPNKSIWSNFERMEGFFMILHLWMFFVVAGELLVKKLWNYWMQTSIGVSIIIALYGCAQLAGKIDIRQGADRLDGTLGNAAYLAVYMLLNIGFVGYLLVKKETATWIKYTYGVIILLQLFIIFKTATRGTILGLGVGLMIGAVVYAWKAKEDRIGRKIAAGILLLIVIGGGLLVSLKNTNFVKNNTTLYRLSSISFDNARTKYIWPMALKGSLEHPVLGYGQEGFNYILNKHYNPKMWTEEQWFDRAHNVFLDWLVAAGILGFGMYISLYVFALIYIWKGDYSVKEKAILIGVLVAYTIHNLTVFDNISSYILFFAFLAFLHSRKAKDHIKNIPIQVDVRDLIVVPAIILVCGIAVYFVNIVPIRVSSLIIDGLRSYPEGLQKNKAVYEQAMSYSVTGAQEAREQIISASEGIIRSSKDQNAQIAFFELAQKAIKAQIDYAPTDARMYLLGAGFLDRLGQFTTALPLLEKAHELTPQKQAPLFELGSNMLNQKKYTEAEMYLRQAFDLDPNYPEAQALYAIGLLYSGKMTELKALLIKYPSIKDDARFTGSLKDTKTVL